MTYIENIFLCMASPLLVAALCMGRRQLRFFLFCIAGMGVCLLSAYINTFLAAVCQADALAATAEIAPVVEEIMKLLPLVFYLLVFEPEGDKIKAAAITIALSFATFENVCYLIQNGADRFSFIFFRGFGTGAMHVLCGGIVGEGLAYAWQRTWLKIAGTCGLLGAAITFHAIHLRAAFERLSIFLKIFIFGVRVFPFFCTYISEGTFTSPRSIHEERSGPETCMIPQGGSRSSKSGGTSTPAGSSSVRSADCPPRVCCCSRR